MDAGAIEVGKRAAARAAVAEVAGGMLVGLGTGSTAAYAIAALGERVRNGLAIRAVATSATTAALARDAGMTMIDFAGVGAIDLCIDGVDEIDADLRAIKGAGGAMLREKIVAASAARMIAIADSTKAVARLGAKPLPVEVLPFAGAFAAARLLELGGTAVRRRAGEGPYRTDQGNIVLDCDFGPIADPDWLAAALSAIPGVLGHGLFLDEIDALYLGEGARAVRRDRPVPREGGVAKGRSILRDVPSLGIANQELS